MQELLIPCLHSTFSIKSEIKTNGDADDDNNDDREDKINDKINVKINKNSNNKNNEESVLSNLVYQHGHITLDQWLYKFCKTLIIKIEEMYIEFEKEHNKNCIKSNRKRSSPRNHNKGKHKKQLKAEKLFIENNKKKLQTFKACLCIKNHASLTTYL